MGAEPETYSETRAAPETIATDEQLSVEKHQHHHSETANGAAHLYQGMFDMQPSVRILSGIDNSQRTVRAESLQDCFSLVRPRTQRTRW